MFSVINEANKISQAMDSANLKEKIELPEIVAIGSQSAGKTSVIESLIGHDCLPRGTSLVTRVPLEIQCVRERCPKVYFSFSHTNNVFNDNEEVMREIRNRTSELAGDNKNIVDKPIKMTIHDPNAIDLTLIDLPGMIENIEGDQPHDTIDDSDKL